MSGEDTRGTDDGICQTNAHQGPRTHTSGIVCDRCGGNLTQATKGHGRRRFCSTRCRAGSWRNARRNTQQETHDDTVA